MMLIQSSIDAHLSSLHNNGKQEILCVWIQDNDHKNKNDSLSSSQISTEINMSETSKPKPNLVYKRRIIHKNSTSTPTPTPTLVYKRKKVQTICCSSSKSNMEIGSVSLKQQQQTDDIGECSSSVVMKDLSETNSCFEFLEHHLVLQRFKGLKGLKGSCFNKVKDVEIEKGICGLRVCKVCEKSTLTLKMLICDLCEESFHMSCCNLKKVPVGDWFCHSCLSKKLKKMEGKSPKGYFGPIVDMLRDVDCYKSDVRIGKDFQAEVPDWSGPLIDQLNDYHNLSSEINPSDSATYQDWDSSKLSRLSCIGNWVQCREIVDHENGIVCGKWRRAPLFEVQSDNWECFSSVLWDPIHADCAVPQELCTDQVLKQLKYIEMLRPRLSAKRWKLRVHKGVDGEEHTGDPRNTQKS
ncbi:uncharacterized protein LOC111889287 isoform X2 [Lactuca sativa]|uniref:PHD-type domain-containing protein n=1 Tax=Lactuca sativa TaxID=4236 RepID=A0A9R1UZ04_LACSA|nr:uncharacterized protein LOC111889287 isoform X2 [Lactuca sativa]KAJ0196912.1 hypothetical protein LSAT_V11C700362980 [Lactuca sativa]